MPVLATLKPNEKRHVIDLVREAGHDVSDWSNYARGPRFASSNPRYCYEWCFSQPGSPTILNLWHAQMEERDGKVSLRANLRASVRRYTDAGGSHRLWRQRAEKLDSAIATAARTDARVRVIINDGRMRVPNDPNAKASSVQRRFLDPLPWRVVSYDHDSGDALLVRGPASGDTADQFSQPLLRERPAMRRPVGAGQRFVRDPAIAAYAQLRAAGHCEFCGEPGFPRADGTVYLETHHIIPFEHGGPDSVDNVAAVCATHHREAHHGARASFIRDHLLQRIRRVRGRRAV